MTLLLLLKIINVLGNFLILLDTILDESLMELKFCQQIYYKYDVTMTSYYVIVSTKLYLDVENDKYIIMCNLGTVS